MSKCVVDRLRQIRSELAAVVLIVEDGHAKVTPEATRELARIESYLSRISARIDPARPKIERLS